MTKGRLARGGGLPGRMLGGGASLTEVVPLRPCCWTAGEAESVAVAPPGLEWLALRFFSFF